MNHSPGSARAHNVHYYVECHTRPLLISVGRLSTSLFADVVLTLNVLGIIDAAILWFYGIVVLVLTAKNWQNPAKTKRNNFSESLCGFFFIVFGFYMVFLFNGEHLSDESQSNLYGLILIAFAVILIWAYGNMSYTWWRVRKDPNLLAEDAPITRHYPNFLAQMDARYQFNGKRGDFIKDLSRKLLHLVMLAVIIGSQVIAFSMVSTLQSIGFTPIAFRDFLYVIVAFFFIFMFTTADLFRLNKFQYLPDWAIKWFLKSLEPTREKYTFISSVPFLLTIMLFIWAPVQVIFSVAIIACVADAAASVVGKSLGRHKMTNFGIYPEKSFEGLIAGAACSFLGVIITFYFYPMSIVTGLLLLVLGAIAVVSFIYVDAFAKNIVDNVLNVLVPGISMLISLWIFTFIPV